MKVHFFGRLADLLGKEMEVQMDTPCTVGDLRDRLAALDERAAAALGDRRVRAFIGDEMVTDSRSLRPGDEVEFLAPVSGG